jgi:hypothetical protein
VARGAPQGLGCNEDAEDASGASPTSYRVVRAEGTKQEETR